MRGLPGAPLSNRPASCGEWSWDQAANSTETPVVKERPGRGLSGTVTDGHLLSHGQH